MKKLWMFFAFGVGASFVAESVSSIATARGLPSDLPDSAAANALRQYYDAFLEYEQSRIQKGKKEYRQAWQKTHDHFREQHRKLLNEKIAILRKAARRYRTQLGSHQDAGNRPYVMFNLAQVLNQIADHLALQEIAGAAKRANGKRRQALELLQRIATRFESFEQRDKVKYLQAVILTTLGQRENALKIWQQLAKSPRDGIEKFRACLAIGDVMFDDERSHDAMKAYQKATKIVPKLDPMAAPRESLRVYYRLAWAAFRAGEARVVIAAASEILAEGMPLLPAEERDKVRKDAVELMGDSLYENNEFSFTRSVLALKEISRFAADVGRQTILRYNQEDIHEEAIRLGRHLIETFPLALEIPEILRIVGDSYGKIGDRNPRMTRERMTTLEKLALLLPKRSLWRARHARHFDAVEKMESAAAAATDMVAAYHYDSGMASGNLTAFLTAANFYEILLDHQPNDKSSNVWRLRRAHCHYFAGKYERAKNNYQDLIKRHKVEPETLEIATYQLALTNEKRWRQRYSIVRESGEDHLRDKVAIAAVEDLERSVDRFASRFPSQNRAVDLMLVSASAHRDMERFGKAMRFWRRVLVSNPTPAQRGLAIRGLVIGTMKEGASTDVIKVASRFLKLEDWKTLGLSIRNELLGVLATAATDESERLNRQGHVREAGDVLRNVAEAFPQIPRRDKLYRDAGYLFAAAGAWSAAEAVARGYMETDLTPSRGDMVYLLARAQEYQVELQNAAQHYLQIGERFPRHTRAKVSLQRAERLGAAEGDHALAAKAAAILAEREPNRRDRLQHYARAVEHMEDSTDIDAAMAIARKRLRRSRSLAEKYSSQLLLAKLNYKTGVAAFEQEAIDDYMIISRKLDRDRSRVGKDYGSLAGEVNFLLGEEARQKFEGFSIAQRSGGFKRNFKQKNIYYQELVEYYGKSARSGDSQWATQARFQLARASEQFADEIASIPNSDDGGVSLTSANIYADRIRALRATAKEHYSANVLAAERDPSRFRENQWVRLSGLRLTGMEGQRKYKVRYEDRLPSAIEVQLPSEWSL